FRRSQPPFDALSRNARARQPGFTAHVRLGEPLERIECAVGADDDAAQAAVAHEQIAAEADPLDGHLWRRGAQACSQVLAVVRIEESFRGAAHVPGGVAAQGLITPHPGRKLGSKGDAHAFDPNGSRAPSEAGSVCATALMLPAPMATITSPSRISFSRTDPSSSTRSTKIGSRGPTPPAPRPHAPPSAPP